MALLSVIRRWHFREGMPIREITRRTALSRNTVRKYLASGVVEPRYPKRKSPSKLDDYELTLTSWLFRDSGPVPSMNCYRITGWLLTRCDRRTVTDDRT
ncbi:MAG: hypothetical protein JAY88_13045, partial [Candidatus Thiodiazotropha lotti]|nr:hypothetical protein [Candidatus Thiodiazotropha lotti]MCW4187990.1 hypothetical protein [Candidatus Thiodiazotropha lotti]